MSNFWLKYKTNYQSIISLGVPILIGQLGSIIVGFADTIMVGRYSTEALASASFVNNLNYTANFACMGFSYGLTPIIGALFTQSDTHKIGSTLRNGILLNLIFSILITGIMLMFYVNVDQMNQPQELLPLIRPYFLLFLAGLIPTAIFNAFAQWSYAIGNSRMPMWIILISNVVNIIGNWLLIYGNFGCPELGLTGAGVSTLIARVLCPTAIIAIFICAKKYSEYRQGFAKSKLCFKQLKHITRTSLPIALQFTLESGSFAFAAVVAGWLGAIELASYQIVVIVGTLGFCIYYSMGASVSVLVANAAGLNDRVEMRRIAFAGYHIMLLLATMSSLTFIIFGKTLIGAFTSDPLVITTASTLIVPLVLYQLGDATQINFANALRGTSNVMPMLWIALVCYVIIGIPATYLIAITASMGIFGVILSFSIPLFLAGALFLYFFMKTTKE
ncbi:MAG: MATE family efflux transporter [Muribaculaceae bacterium]|nr:MATE family efflux transporter [Muribaculaceae bacterium]